MKKAMLLATAILAFTGAAAVPALADDFDKGMWVDFHSSTAQYGLGAAKQIADDYWVGVRADDLVSGEPTVGVNGLYVVPKKFFFLELYGGVGLEYSFKDNKPGAHIVAGNQFWFFFSEAEYNFNAKPAEYRGGIRIKF